MGLFRLIVEQRVLANLLFFVLLIAGFMVVGQMPVEEYPNVALDKILITVPWPGAAPEEIERLVSTKIEERVEEIQGIEWVQASSYPDRCEVWVKVRSDAEDFQTVYRDIQTEISKIRDLPKDAEDPIVTKIDIEEMGPVLQIVVGWRDDGTKYSKEEIESILRSHALSLDILLEQDIPDVKKVRVYGNRDRELRVLIDPERLLHYQVTIDEVAEALRTRNVNLPAGTLKGAGREIMVRGSSELESVEAFRQVPLRSDDTGPTVRLGDVASLDWAFERGSVWSRFRGQACLTLAVVKRDSANAVTVAKETRDIVDEFKKKAHPNVTFDVVADTTIRVQERIAVLGGNIILGLVLVLVVLWMTIGFKNAILGSLGIPFSFLVSLILLKWGGESINVISLFSMVIVLGVIVDDALVVLENIHRHFEMGKPLKTAIIEGASEVAIPVVSATLTTIAAFLPLLLMPGTTGRFFAIIPKTVAYALLASLFECLLILPIHILDLGPSKKAEHQEPSRLLLGMRSMYQKALRLCLRLRYLSLVGLFFLALLALLVLSRIPVLFFPSDFKQFFVNVTMPVGTSLEETEKVALSIGEVIDNSPKEEIESGVINVGMYFDSNYKMHTESHYAQVFVTTARGSLKTLSVQEIMAKVRQKIADKNLIGAKVEVTELSDGPPVGRPITVRLRGDNLDKLWARSREIMGILNTIPGVSNVDSDLTLGKDELHFRLLDDAGSRQGITAMSVGRALAFSNDGAVLTKWRVPGEDEEVDVRVLYDESERKSQRDLEEIRLRNKWGVLVPLSDVIEVTRKRGFSGIHRYDGKRAITISADIDPAITTAVAASEKAKEAALKLSADPSIVIDFEGEFAETNRSFDSLKVSFVVAIGCIFMVLGAQFRSFLQPFVVLFTVPFSFIGVAYGLWLTGDPFTMASGIAIVGLAGMVVNDSLVLVDFVNRLRAEGLSVEDALCEGASNRVRAILLTTVTTVFGVLPMALGVGGRSPVWSPMATSISFGLSFATVLTLFVIPALYMILEDMLSLQARIMTRLRLLLGRSAPPANSEDPEPRPVSEASGEEQTGSTVPENPIELAGREVSQT